MADDDGERLKVADVRAAMTMHTTGPAATQARLAALEARLDALEALAGRASAAIASWQSTGVGKRIMRMIS